MSTFLNTLLRRNLEPSTPMQPRRASRFEPWQAIHSPPPDEAMPIHEQPSLPDRPIGTVQRPAAPAPRPFSDASEPAADETRPEVPHPSETASAEPPERSETPPSPEPSLSPETAALSEEPPPPNATVRLAALESNSPFPDAPAQHRSKPAPETPTTNPKRTISTRAVPHTPPAEPSTPPSEEQDAPSTEERLGLSPAIRPLASEPVEAPTASQLSPTEPPEGSDTLEAASAPPDTLVRHRPKSTLEISPTNPKRTVSIRAVPRTPHAVALGQQAASGNQQEAKSTRNSGPEMSSAEHAESSETAARRLAPVESDPIMPRTLPGSIAPQSVAGVPIETIRPPAQEASPEAPSEETTPTIRVSIGRIDVRAVTPLPQTMQRTPARPAPALSLDDYLKQQSERR